MLTNKQTNRLTDATDQHACMLVKQNRMYEFAANYYHQSKVLTKSLFFSTGNSLSTSSVVC